ncbi:MAG TPA: chemotaxis protein CheW [Candidatus Cloacimonadota bacterium]|nr:chemotaxis protein CheW [Candidatus Cloacimonadota bacterium]
MENQVNDYEQKKRAILKQRAKLLAKKPIVAEASGRIIEGLEFVLANEHYLISSNFVSEVSKINTITPLPLTPDFLMGIINLRGKILVVIDIKSFLDLPSAGITDLNKIIIVEDKGIEFCILADEIVGSREVNLDSLQKNSEQEKKINSDFIAGVTKDLLIVLNVERLIHDERLVIN